MQILRKLKKILTNKKVVYGILILIAILFSFFIIRGCTRNPSLKKSVYLIARESPLQLELFGREKNIVAFVYDLIANIAEENHLHLQWVETNPGHLTEGLDNGTYDFILTSLRPSIINQERYDLSEMILSLGPVLIVREESEISSLKELGEKPIGIAYGQTINYNALRTPGLNIYNLNLHYYTTMNRALEDLTNDNIDGVIMPAIEAYAIVRGYYAGKLKVVTSPFIDEGLRIASFKNAGLEEIINLFNESINVMRKNGSYIKFIDKWNLVDPQSQYWHPAET